MTNKGIRKWGFAEVEKDWREVVALMHETLGYWELIFSYLTGFLESRGERVSRVLSWTLSF